MSDHNTLTGLYDPSFEKDSCGFGLIANIDDKPSHWLVKTSIEALARLTHRGAVAADGKSGDGCGLLLKKPDGFLRAKAKELGFHCARRYAVGLVFVSPFEGETEASQAVIDEKLVAQGLEVAGWREMPINPAACGEEALKSLPAIYHVFRQCARRHVARRIQPFAVSRAPRRRPRLRSAGQPPHRAVLLHLQPVQRRALLQGSDHPGEPADLLPGPRRPGAGVGDLRVPPAILHQHLAAVETGATVPLPGAQR